MSPLKAIYEKGVFKPIGPVSLKDGTQVDVFISEAVGPAEARCAAALLAEIASLPESGGGAPISGREHDRVLYGRGTPEP